MTLTYGSVCSGIEAATAAWHPLGWKAAFFSEIEKFPRAVLVHHYPGTPLHGDFTTIKDGEYDPIDLLVGGTPCQSFSIAGLRGGMADARGNLALQYLALASRLRPRWVVWENVPGVLSSNGGRDFGSFLGGLVELGYGFAYRVLDAQYFGLAQRRARVFVVGYLGDWRHAAAVLFERESLSGHPAPRREKRKRPSPTIGAGPTGGEGRSDGSVIAGTLNANGKEAGSATQQDAENGMLLARCDTTREGRHHDPSLETFVTHSLRADGFDASEDGTGRGTPLIPVHAIQAGAFNITPTNSNKDFNAREAQYAQAVTAGGNRPSARGWDLIAFNHQSGGDFRPQPSADLANPLQREQGQAICFSAKDHGADAGDISPTLRAGGHAKSHANAGVMPAVAFAQNTRDEIREMPYAGALAAEPGMKQQTYIREAMSVRRLTPRECERLQGFPDDFTLIPYRGKPAADGPRYKALGNSMAVSVMRWIGGRIQEVEDIIQAQKLDVDR